MDTCFDFMKKGDNLTNYILRRLGISLMTLFIIFTVTFFLMNAVPGGPFQSDKMTEATKINLNIKYGLDKPIYVQYVNYLVHAVQGDLGISVVNSEKISVLIGNGFKVSAQIGGLAIFLSLFFGLIIGVLASLNRGKLIDNILMIISTIGIAVPGFVVATICMIVFTVQVHWLPTSGLDEPASYILPSFALCFFSLSFIAKIIRSSMLDVIGQDYIKTAKSKGLKNKDVILKHALRNAILPVVTYMGPLVADILVGSFVIEKIFRIPGLGRAFVESISQRDYPLILGTTIFYGAILILMNLLVDIAYGFIDPRIKLKSQAN